MIAAENPEDSSPPHDYTALTYIVVLGLVEVGLLYLLIAVETPLSPIVRRLMRNPFGVFTVVMVVVMILVYGMIAFLTLAERAAKRKGRLGAGVGSGERQKP